MNQELFDTLRAKFVKLSIWDYEEDGPVGFDTHIPYRTSWYFGGRLGVATMVPKDWHDPMVANIDRGVAALDALGEPSWPWLIDLDYFEMSSGSSCVCGQLFSYNAQIADNMSIWNGYEWAVNSMLEDWIEGKFVDPPPSRDVDAGMGSDMEVVRVPFLEDRKVREYATWNLGFSIGNPNEFEFWSARRGLVSAVVFADPDGEPVQVVPFRDHSYMWRNDVMSDIGADMEARRQADNVLRAVQDSLLRETKWMVLTQMWALKLAGLRAERVKPSSEAVMLEAKSSGKGQWYADLVTVPDDVERPWGWD